MATWYSLPAEVRLIIYRNAFEEATIAESTHGSIFKNPANPCPEISDIFLSDKVPEHYQKWVHDPDNDAYEEHCRRKTQSNFWYNEVEHKSKCENNLGTWKSAGGNALLSMNRLAYQEALQIAYDKTTFKFDWHGDMIKFIRCVRSHNNARLVKHIQLVIRDLILDGRLPDFIGSLKSDGLKRVFENLETITIELDAFSFTRNGQRRTFYVDQDVRDGGCGRDRVEACVRDLMQSCHGLTNLKILVIGLESPEFEKYLSETATAIVCRGDRPGMETEVFDRWYEEFRKVAGRDSGWDDERGEHTATCDLGSSDLS